MTTATDTNAMATAGTTAAQPAISSANASNEEDQADEADEATTATATATATMTTATDTNATTLAASASASSSDGEEVMTRIRTVSLKWNNNDKKWKTVEGTREATEQELLSAKYDAALQLLAISLEQQKTNQEEDHRNEEDGRNDFTRLFPFDVPDILKHDLMDAAAGRATTETDLLAGPMEEGFHLFHRHIFLFLASTDLGKCRCVSKDWYCWGLDVLQDPSHPKKAFTTNKELKEAVRVCFAKLPTHGEPYCPESNDFFRVHCLYGHVIGNWDVSELENFIGTFADLCEFNEPLQWDTRNATDMSFMFCFCRNFNSSLGPNFCTSKVTNMRCMFKKCAFFNQDVSHFNTSDVENMSKMFYGCGQFNQDVSHFNTSKVKDMRQMFYGCDRFEQSLETFDTSSVVRIGDMLQAPYYKEYRERYGRLFPVRLWGWDLSQLEPSTSRHPNYP